MDCLRQENAQLETKLKLAQAELQRKDQQLARLQDCNASLKLELAARPAAPPTEQQCNEISLTPQPHQHHRPSDYCPEDDVLVPFRLYQQALDDFNPHAPALPPLATTTPLEIDISQSNNRVVSTLTLPADALPSSWTTAPSSTSTTPNSRRKARSSRTLRSWQGRPPPVPTLRRNQKDSTVESVKSPLRISSSVHPEAAEKPVSEQVSIVRGMDPTGELARTPTLLPAGQVVLLAEAIRSTDAKKQDGGDPALSLLPALLVDPSPKANLAQSSTPIATATATAATSFCYNSNHNELSRTKEVVNRPNSVDAFGECGTYTGSFCRQSHLPDGYGEMKYSSCREYMGDWAFGHWEGYGILKNALGDVYDGEFVVDVKFGQGKLRFADGRFFCGRFQNDQMREGILWFQDGSKYNGLLENGKRNGFGRYDYADTSWYEGQWDKDKMHGRGRMEWAGGGWYNGDWENGIFHGVGMEVNTDGTLRHLGKWEHGVPSRQTQHATAERETSAAVAVAVAAGPPKQQQHIKNLQQDSKCRRYQKADERVE
jgi:hypothetical protein